MVKAVIAHVRTRDEKVLTFKPGTEPRDVLHYVRQVYPDWVFTEYKEVAAA